MNLLEEGHQSEQCHDNTLAAYRTYILSHYSDVLSTINQHHHKLSSLTPRDFLSIMTRHLPYLENLQLNLSPRHVF